LKIIGTVITNIKKKLNETDFKRLQKLEEDIDGIELFEELKVLKNILPKNY
jgi:hypothetical protein